MKLRSVDIKILTDGDRTVAEACLYPCVEGVGSSSRDRADKSDPEIGEALAVARALRKIAAKLERQAAGMMKHREDIKAHRQEIADRREGKLILDSLTEGTWPGTQVKWK